jgi:CBS domain containing-hemolysin-like protein
MLILFLLAIALSFLLSGLETAVLSVSRVRVQHAANEKDKRAKKLLLLLEDRDGLLGSLIVANHVANFAAFGFITWQIVNTWGQPGYLVGFLLALPLFIIGLEVVPKNLFRRYPYRALIRFLPIIRAAAMCRGLFNSMRQLPVLPSEEGGSSGRDDLSRLIQDMAKSQLLPASANEIMQRVLSSRPVTARSIMVPRDRMACIQADSAAEAARHLARQRGFSSLVVSDPGDETHLIGLIQTTHLPSSIPSDRMVRQHTRSIERVDARTPTLVVLQRLRRRGMNLALVTEGSDGNVVGLISEEDILATLLPRV